MKGKTSRVLRLDLVVDLAANDPLAACPAFCQCTESRKLAHRNRIQGIMGSAKTNTIVSTRCGQDSFNKRLTLYVLQTCETISFRDKQAAACQGCVDAGCEGTAKRS